MIFDRETGLALLGILVGLVTLVVVARVLFPPPPKPPADVPPTDPEEP